MNDGDGDGSEDKAEYSVMDGLTGKLNLQPSTAQLLFQSQLQRAACRLLGSMGIEGSVMQHRIYEDEVIELSPDVSVILLLPPPDSVCAVAGQSEALFHRPEFLSVPVQVFEMIHLRTYQRDLIGRYSRLSSILELDSNLAQLAMREVSFSLSLLFHIVVLLLYLNILLLCLLFDRLFRAWNWRKPNNASSGCKMFKFKLTRLGGDRAGSWTFFRWPGIER